MAKENAKLDAADERALFRRLVDDQLSPEEFHALEQRLLSDRDFRARYVRYLDLEAGLYAELGTIPPRVAPSEVRPRRRPARAVALALSAAVAMVVLAGFALHFAGREPTAQYVEVRLRGIADAAIVTHVEGPVARDGGPALKPGARLKPGVLVLRQGQVQLEFLSGAKVLLQGPAELHILSPEAATLVAGKAATRVLQWGKGFVLNTPEATFVDLGTEFGLAVDEQQGSELHVVDGEVEVSVLGDDGSTLINERVRESRALRVRPGAGVLEASRNATVPFPKIVDRPAGPLAVPARYVRAVMDSQPLVYWRFESLEGNLVPNEVGPNWAARLHGDAEDPPLIQIDGGLARFSMGDRSRYIAPDEPFPKLNSESFSIEFWINPDMLHWATLVGIVPEDDARSSRHLNVIELAHRTSLVHEAGAFRFLHRYPPKTLGGMNVFTPVGCTPGQWHHVVAVKTPQELRLYLNGRLARRLDGAMGSGDSAYRLFLGQLRTSTAERQFAGSLDEFALYVRPLSEAEVNRHYSALVGDGKLER